MISLNQLCRVKSTYLFYFKIIFHLIRSSIGTKFDPKTKTYLQGSAGPFGMNQTWKPHPMHSVLAGSGQNFNTTYRGGYNRLRGS